MRSSSHWALPKLQPFRSKLIGCAENTPVPSSITSGEPYHTPGHFRIEPADAVRAADDEIGWMKNISLDEFQNFACGSIKSNTKAADPSFPSCVIPIVGS
jgi:hypothetical protein